MAQANRDSSGVAAQVHPRKRTLYATLAGYMDKRPADFPPLDRAALMRDAHATARKFRQFYASYREALAYGNGERQRNVSLMPAQFDRGASCEAPALRCARRRLRRSLWPFRVRVHLILPGDIQITMLYGLHHWILSPEAIVHPKGWQARRPRNPAD
jgi:hypothetical protein